MIAVLPDTKPTKELTASELGKLGGGVVLKRYGKDYFKELSKKGVEARKAKKGKDEPRSFN